MAAELEFLEIFKPVAKGWIGEEIICDHGGLGGGQREEFPASVSGWALGPLTEGQGRKGPLAPRPPIFPTQGVALKLWPVTPREKYVLHGPPAHRRDREIHKTVLLHFMCNEGRFPILHY